MARADARLRAARESAGTAKRARHKISKKFEKGVDKGERLWYYETPAASGGVHLVN